MIMAKMTMKLMAFDTNTTVVRCTHSEGAPIGPQFAEWWLNCSGSVITMSFLLGSKAPLVFYTSRDEFIECVTASIEHSTATHEPQEGDLVLVRQSESDKWEGRILVCKLDSDRAFKPYICVHGAGTDDWSEGNLVNTAQWRHMKPIDRVKVTNEGDLVTWEW
jgi:hypothetical protein